MSAFDFIRRRFTNLAGSGKVRLSTVGLTTGLVAGTGFFAYFVNTFYPLEHWLFFIYTQYWLYTLLFGAACISGGLWLLKVILPRPSALGERLALGMGLGVLLFFWGMFVGGLLGLYGRFFFFAWPLALLALGARTTWAVVKGANRLWRRFGIALVRPRGLIEMGAAVLIVLALAALYFVVLLPRHIGADAYWYHLPIAEHYAAAGRIGPFAEGWYLGAYPQLSSILYTWAFLAPGSLIDHTELSSHIEWLLFLATVASIPVLTRRVLGGIRVPFAAAAMFLFPGLFLYDSSLITCADHVLAFWAIPIGIALLRMGNRFEPRQAVLAGLLTAGAILTKYQGSYFFVAAVLVALVMTIKTRKLLPAVAWAVPCFLATSAHWLKNILFYGDPFYPLLHKYFPAHPFHPGAEELFQHAYWVPMFELRGTPVEKIRDTLTALVSFSFVPHDWDFHGDKPVFGSVFTLLLVTLPFLRPRKRLWALVAGVHVGVLVWFVTSHEDRFLQALVPWMAAATAAVIVLIWKQGWLPRIGLAALLGLQLVWGSDVYFFRVHAMLGDSPIKHAIDLMASGHQGHYDPKERFRLPSETPDFGAKLPKGAVVVYHDHTGPLGLMSVGILDSPGWQGAIDYLALETPRAVSSLWRELGANHIAWRRDRRGLPPESLARDAVFLRAAFDCVRSWSDVSGVTWGELAGACAIATSEVPTRIAWLGCGGDPPAGLYTPSGLVKRKPIRPLAGSDLDQSATATLAEANAIVVRPQCGTWGRVMPILHNQFESTIEAGEVTLWIRKSKRE